jgi:archaeal flagellar protein FlaJ
MTVLANCGLSIDRIFTQIADIEQNPTIKKLMSSFILDIKLLGYDIEQGLRRLMERSPSKSFSDILNSISNANWASGDLKEIMGYHFEVLDRKRKDETENMINSLTVLSEIYVAMMVIAPIMLIIMFTLLSVLMSGMNSTSTITILNSITFILLPFVGAGFLVILDTLRGAD